MRKREGGGKATGRNGRKRKGEESLYLNCRGLSEGRGFGYVFSPFLSCSNDGRTLRRRCQVGFCRSSRLSVLKDG